MTSRNGASVLAQGGIYQQDLLCDACQLGMDGAGGVGLHQSLPPFAGTGNDAGGFQPVQFALDGPGTAPGFGNQFGHAEPAFGVAEQGRQHALLAGSEQSVGKTRAGQWALHVVIIPFMGIICRVGGVAVSSYLYL
ncbi:MAG: hypothetical protein QM769_03485 [Pseudoxanthomonas sp.]